MEHDLISVIVPVYNAEQTLGRCIHSLLDQTYENMEIILIDDGSKDRSIKIINRFSEIDPRIRIILNKNSGPGIARNKGLDFFTGDYFCFVDSDDYVAPGYLSDMHTAAKEYQADIVQCSYQVVEEDGTFRHSLISNPELLLSPADCLLAFSRQEKIHNFPWGKLFKSDKFGNIRFPGLYKSEDKVFLFKALSLCDHYYISDKVLYYYVATSESLSRGRFSMKDFDEVKAGLEIYYLCLPEYNELSRYWAGYVASRSALLYCKLYGSKLKNKEELMKKITDLFKTYYPKSFTSLTSRNKSRALFLQSFHFSKWLTATIYNL